MALFSWPWSRASKVKTVAKRAYNGATFNRQMLDWIASSTSQDAETRMALRALRNRSRDLGRNHDYVVNAFRTIMNNVVGTGVRMQSQIKTGRGPGSGKLDKNRNLAVEAAWTRWCRARNCHTGGTLSFSAIERLLIRAVAQDGDVGVRMVYQSFGSSPVPLALEVIEADLLDEELNGRASNGNEIRMGVEVNEWQRPVAYHFFDRHPGDYQRPGVNVRKHLRIPADEIIWLFRAERPGMTRGIPWLASTVTRVRHMGGYEEAEVIAARASACQMGFIETPDGDHENDDVIAGEAVTEFQPGKISSLAAGEKFVSHSPTRPSGLLDPFMRYMLRGVAAGVGVSYESLSKDYSQSNFSSSRMGMLDDRDNWRIIQLWMIETFHQRVFETWLERAVLANVLDLPGFEIAPDRYDTPKWMPRGWAWIDPAKEVKAYKDAVRCGFMTQTSVLAQNGEDFDETVAARRRELDAAEENGIIWDTDPKVTTVNGQLQGDAAPEPAETNVDGDGNSSGTDADKEVEKA